MTEFENAALARLDAIVGLLSAIAVGVSANLTPEERKASQGVINGLSDLISKAPGMNIRAKPVEYRVIP